MKKKIEGFRDLIRAGVLLAIYYTFVLSGWIPELLKDVVKTPDQLGYLTFASMLVPLIVGIVLYYKDLKIDYEKSYEEVLLKFHKIILTVILLFFMQGILSMTVFRNFPQSENQEMINYILENVFSVGFVMSVCLLGPFVEEMIFREVLIHQAGKYFNRYLVASISCFLFALMHATNWMELLQYLPLSIVMTVVYLKHDENTLYNICLHALYNTATMWAILSAMQQGI